MGNGKDSKNSGSLLARLLVICYATAIVAIGLYPVRNNIKSFFEKLSKQTGSYSIRARLAKEGEVLKEEEPETISLNFLGVFSDFVNSIARPKSERGIEQAGTIARPEISTKSEEKQSDKLTSEDQEELDELVEKL